MGGWCLVGSQGSCLWAVGAGACGLESSPFVLGTLVSGSWSLGAFFRNYNQSPESEVRTPTRNPICLVLLFLSEHLYLRALHP